MPRAGSIFAAVLTALAIPALAAAAGTFEEAIARQKNGLWEMKVAGVGGPPMRFCVTDEAKLHAWEETAKALAKLGCKPATDVRTGERFEIRYACVHQSEAIGTFEYLITGSVRTDRIDSQSRLVGGGPLIQQLAGTLAGTSTGRWLRPCLATEKPGLQGR
jgi:hypothetical protein